ncbi:MAG TPA: alpha/beta fold hydrolase [Candidatus Tumulicola sp.]|jgi:alpha-beta hydrolase superfamily lysophospholipase
MIVPPAPKPAANYAEALQRFDAMSRRDGGEILEAARTKALLTGSPAPLAVVLLHGYTNNPAQYSAFAPLLHARGVNVVIPRMPLHGYRDRLTEAIANLIAADIVDTTAEALDIAAGFGDRVGVLGISMTGAVAALFAQHRALAVAVPVAPDFGLLRLPYAASRAIAWAALRIPNFFLWWDPRDRANHVPLTAYPRFSTHALARTMAVGDAVIAAARRSAPAAERIVTVVNRADPAVNVPLMASVVRDWARWKSDVEFVQLTDLPRNHDIVSPDDPLARTGLVYPKLLEALLGPNASYASG